MTTIKHYSKHQFDTDIMIPKITKILQNSKYQSIISLTDGGKTIHIHDAI